MDIVYFGKICDDQIYKEIELKGLPYFVAQYSYEKALVGEFEKTFYLSVNSIYQTEYYPEDKILINKNNKENKYNYLVYINIPFLREITFFLSTLFTLFKWYRNSKEKERLIYTSNHYPPVSLAIVIFGNIFNINKVVTFTDLSLFTYSEARIKKMKLYKKIVMKPYLNLVNMLQESYDGYVLFSKEMNKVVNKRNKPFVICEGIFNSANLDFERNNKKKAITHAGTLNKEVGIQKIIDVFLHLNKNDYELWLIGKGDMEEQILEASEKNSSIKYLGFMPKPEVFEKLKQSTLLINLRNSDDIYTKYSFPSKMFEYMASGTPVFTTRIDGIPSEYYDHVYSVDSYETEEIASYLNRIMGFKSYTLLEKGLEAQNFIIEEKNPKKQFNKVKKFLLENFN